MKSNIYTFILLALVVVGIVIAARFVAHDKEKDKDSGKLEVAATIFALYDIAKNVAGDKAIVHLALPPGASPHTFEFSPKEISRIKNVKAIFSIGYGLDDWVRVVDGSIPGVEFLTVDNGIALRESAENHNGDHGIIDPHYWLNFTNAGVITDNIKNALVRLDPKNKETYEENASNYKELLAKKESELIIKAALVQGAKILTLHDAWFYFADNFNLEVAGSFEPSAGKEPTPRYLAELLKKIQEDSIMIIFAERQVSSASLKNFASENNLVLAILDPIEGGAEGRDSFIEVMEYNVNTVVDAFESKEQ